MPRVAISGPSGTGKTTLAMALAGATGLPLVGEGVREWCAGRGVARPADLPPEQARQMQEDLLAARIDRERALPAGFVADRASMDHACYALLAVGRDAAMSDWAMEYVARCLCHGREMYDLIVVTRPGSRFLEDDGVRTALPARQVLVGALIEGLLAKLAPRLDCAGRAWPVVRFLTGDGDRLDQVRGWMEEVRRWRAV